MTWGLTTYQDSGRREDIVTKKRGVKRMLGQMVIKGKKKNKKAKFGYIKKVTEGKKVGKLAGRGVGKFLMSRRSSLLKKKK